MRRGEIAHTVSRGAFYLSLEKLAALLSGILYFALLLRWMGPTKYGIITLALSFVGLASIATGNFEVYLERYAAEHEARGRLRTLLRSHRLALALKLALGSLASLGLVGLAPLLARQFQTPELTTLLPVLSLIVVCDGLSTTGRGVLYGLQCFRLISSLSVLFHIAKTIMVGLLWWLQRGLPELAMGLALLTAVQAVVQSAVPMWMLRHARDPEPDPAGDERAPGRGGLLASMLAYCMPLLGARVAFMAGQNLSKVIIGRIFGLAQLGFFSFAFQTVERFVELAHTLPSALLPSLTKLVARGERERLRWVFDQAYRLIQVAACALSLVLFLFARELTRWVGSPMFEPAVPLLMIMALVPFARTAHQPLTMAFQALRLPGVILTLALIKLVAEFGSYFLLIPLLGLAGAAWANVIGAMAAFAAAHVALRRHLPESVGDRLQASVRGFALLLPFLGAGLALEALLNGSAATAAKIALAPLAVVAVFAAGLVIPYDLEKASSIPLSSAWLRRTRDRAVAAGDRLVRAIEARRMP